MTFRNPRTRGGLIHWRKPNLYSEAIELVCGGSPIGCVPVECKAQLSGEWEQHQHRTSLDQLGVQHKCTVMVKLMEIYCSSHFTLHRDFPLHEDTANGRATTGEPTLLE